MSSEQQGRVELVGKPGCHLCDAAREVVQRVCGDAYAERSILDDPALHERFWERIPVVLVDGVVVDYWHVDEDRLRGALAQRPPAAPGA
ncbi:glutaredoxin-like protein DUF836 [Motilibacter rhizosphaerae]|uniref:Glutaredoxin-like protein DUF836 n=1 Tax=Motilibacter rhizosphaerae TaxID=598652 RepID=A0A4Q7NA49_9ACTN|nr:glutaredoxin family protein [Motilibacter rhizosphaerae]RZS79062.1 glutaredoxin-like protein DUF836 [Motilibacter rhizosphaerae]